MPRGLTAPLKALLAQDGVFPLWFVAIDLPSTPSYSWTGVGITEQLGKTWYGVGDHGIVQGIQSSRELMAHEISLALVGIPASLIPSSVLARARSQQYQGRDVSVYLSAADMNNGTPQVEPELIWDGFADVVTFRYGKTVSVVLTAEHLSSHLTRPNGLKMTSESHNQRLGNSEPRDLFFDSQSRLAGKPRPLIG